MKIPVDADSSGHHITPKPRSDLGPWNCGSERLFNSQHRGLLNKLNRSPPTNNVSNY